MAMTITMLFYGRATPGMLWSLKRAKYLRSHGHTGDLTGRRENVGASSLCPLQSPDYVGHGD